MHRNAYVKTKNVLNYNLSLKQHPEIFFAGQITGVEGYVESTLTGLIAAVQMDRYIKGIAPIKFSRNTPSGALLNYLFFNISDNMQPMNINFGLFPHRGENREERKARANGKEGKMVDRETESGNFRNHLRKFLEHLEKVKRFSDKTIISYRNDLNQFFPIYMSGKI